MDPVIKAIGTPELAPEVNRVDKYKNELTEIDEKIRLVSLELMSIPRYTPPELQHFQIHAYINVMKENDATKRLCEKHPTAIQVINIPKRPREIKLLNSNLYLVVKCELQYLYNRKLQLQKYIDKASL